MRWRGNLGAEDEDCVGVSRGGGEGGRGEGMVAVGEARLNVVRTFTYFKLKAGVDHEQTIRCS